MFLDKTLRIALLISAIFHTAMFLPLAQFKYSPTKQTQAPLKITYVLPKSLPVKKAEVKVKKKPQAQGRRVNKREIQHKPIAKDKPIQKDKPLKEKVVATRPAVSHPEIEIPRELPREKEAVYLNYYQSIREKIRGFVLNNYPRYITCGEVCLYFVLLSNGQLKEIKIVQERSSQNHLLKEIAKKSVAQAAPFSPFPEDLTQEHLSFNVIISFELSH